ncbi:MAG: universal stress protein [Burkholderiales bacterium]
MFKHILIPTDGSRLASKGIKAGVKLARALGAKVAGAYVMPPYSPPLYSEGAMFAPGASPQEFKKIHEAAARKALAAVEIEAQAAGVACSTLMLTAEFPWKGILDAARRKKCDAIVIASHGRGGLGGLLLGSETTRVLSHSKLPVLVIR